MGALKLQNEQSRQDWAAEMSILFLVDTAWLVIFLFSHFSRLKSHLRKLKPQSFRCPHAKQANRISIQSSNFLAILTSIETYKRVCLWQLLLKPSRNSKCYISTDTRTGQQHKAENRTNHFYECPGYEATFLATLEPTAEIAISLL